MSKLDKVVDHFNLVLEARENCVKTFNRINREGHKHLRGMSDIANALQLLCNSISVIDLDLENPSGADDSLKFYEFPARKHPVDCESLEDCNNELKVVYKEKFIAKVESWLCSNRRSDLENVLQELGFIYTPSEYDYEEQVKIYFNKIKDENERLDAENKALKQQNQDLIGERDARIEEAIASLSTPGLPTPTK